MGPVLRDRALQRSYSTKKINNKGSIVKQNLTSKAGINSRAIAANTASSFLFPLGILGKGAAFEQISQKYTNKELETVLSFFESEELLQVIRQYSTIAQHVFDTLNEGGLTNLSKLLQVEYEKISKMIPVLTNILSKKIFKKSLTEDEKNKIYPFLKDRYRALLDYNTSNKMWNFTSKNLKFLELNWVENAKNVCVSENETDFGITSTFPILS